MRRASTDCVGGVAARVAWPVRRVTLACNIPPSGCGLLWFGCFGDFRFHHTPLYECVEDLKIRVPFVASHDNLADFFTKPLNAKNFFRLRDIIMNISHAT